MNSNIYNGKQLKSSYAIINMNFIIKTFSKMHIFYCICFHCEECWGEKTSQAQISSFAHTLRPSKWFPNVEGCHHDARGLILVICQCPYAFHPLWCSLYWKIPTICSPTKDHEGSSENVVVINKIQFYMIMYVNSLIYQYFVHLRSLFVAFYYLNRYIFIST